jgi:hypothetical protein
VIAAVLLALAAAAPPDPTYLIERVVTIPGAVRRTSVFRNGVAVFVVQNPGEAKRVLRQPLTEVELSVLVQVVEDGYADLARVDGGGQAPVEGSVEMRLAPVGRPPLTLHYPVSAVLPFAAARISQALDGLEANLVRLGGTREDLREWVPKVGDRVVLEDGRTVLVLEAMPAGDRLVLRLQIGDGPASVFMNDDELRNKALRRVDQ